MYLQNRENKLVWHGDVTTILSDDEKFVNAPFGLDEIPKFQFNLGIHRFHVFVQSVQQGNASWTDEDLFSVSIQIRILFWRVLKFDSHRHAFDIFVTNVVNVFDQCADRICMRNNQTFVAISHCWFNH